MAPTGSWQHDLDCALWIQHCSLVLRTEPHKATSTAWTTVEERGDFWCFSSYFRVLWSYRNIMIYLWQQTPYYFPTILFQPVSSRLAYFLIAPYTKLFTFKSYLSCEGFIRTTRWILVWNQDRALQFLKWPWSYRYHFLLCVYMKLHTQ